ncbi:MAG: hypothetical protein IJC13_05655 [Clostridia bacterium]|nr:hypothetical protein [Clostridia bacterium]
MNFEYLNKKDFVLLSRQIFDILADNMAEIAPTGNSRDEDFNCWFSAVSDGLEREERQIILIKNGTEIIGFFQYYVNEDTLAMEEIQLNSEYHGKANIFRNLYGFLFENIPCDLKIVKAFANKKNEKSISILQRLGLKISGENKNGNSYFFTGDFADLLKWHKGE